MAVQTTVLTVLRDIADTRTSTTAGHTIASPKLVMERRRIPTVNQSTFESGFSVVHAAADTDGASLPQSIVIDVKVKYHKDTNPALVAAAQAIAEDIIAGDEFDTAVATGSWLFPS